MRALTPFLMFCREHHGRAEEAIEFSPCSTTRG